MCKCLLTNILIFFVLVVSAQNQLQDIRSQVYQELLYETPAKDRQKMIDAFAVASFISTLETPGIFERELKKIESIEMPSSSPDEMIRYYNEMKTAVDTDTQNLKISMERQLEQDLVNIANLAERELRKLNVKTSTGNAALDGLLKKTGLELSRKKIMQKKEQQIEERKAQYERDLKNELTKKLKPVRDGIISENENSKEQYLYAAAYATNFELQQNYLDYYNFHTCNIYYVKRNFSIEHTRWLNPGCTAPAGNITTTTNNDSFLELAKSKLKLYQKFNNKVFKEAADNFLNMAVGNGEDKGEYLKIKAGQSDNNLDKYFFSSAAQQFSGSEAQSTTEIKRLKQKVNKDIEIAILNNDVDYLAKASEKIALENVEIDRKPILAFSIEHNKSKALNYFLNYYNSKSLDPEKLNNSLLAAAVMSGAEDCLNTLVNNGLNIHSNFIDEQNLLLLAYQYQQPKMFKYLVSNNVKFEPGLSFLKNSGDEETLENLAVELFTLNPASEIEKRITEYIPDFKSKIPTSKKIIITSNPSGLAFTLNNGVSAETPYSTNINFGEYKIELQNRGVLFESDFEVRINNENKFEFECTPKKSTIAWMGEQAIEFVLVDTKENYFYLSKYEYVPQESTGGLPLIVNSDEVINKINDLNEINNFEISYQNLNGKNSIKNVEKEGFRLPTTDEWEFVATTHYNLVQLSQRKHLETIAVFKSNSNSTLQKTGSKKPNELGIYDFWGNLSEWCLTTDGNLAPMGYNYLSRTKDFVNATEPNKINPKTPHCVGIRLVKNQKLKVTATSKNSDYAENHF